MKVETTNLTSLLIYLAVVEIRTREIAVQVCNRNLKNFHILREDKLRKNHIDFDLKKLPSGKPQVNGFE